MLAVADALEGMSRAEAARLAGMERQALRDAVVRYNAEGLAGLRDRPEPGRPERLSEAERAALAARVFRGPDPERDGVAAWTRADLAAWLAARFGKVLHPSGLSRVLKRLDLTWRRARPVHPEADPRAQERFRRKGFATARRRRPGPTHPGKRIVPWFMDEARVGQKGRPCHRCWSKGRRPPGRCDRRFGWAYLFAAVEPATGKEVALVLPRAVALVLPRANAAAMGLFLAELAAGLAEDVHAVLVLDGAGWHAARALVVPPNITPVPLPPYSPELNPVERVWLYLRERFLSLRVFADHRTIVGACCAAWNRLVAEPGRLCSLCDQPWIRKVSS
jgi:transposase